MDKMRGAVEYRLEGPDEIPIIAKYIRAKIQTDAAENLMNDWLTMIDAKGKVSRIVRIRKYINKVNPYAVIAFLETPCFLVTSIVMPQEQSQASIPLGYWKRLHANYCRTTAN